MTYCRSAIILLFAIWPIVVLLLYCYLLFDLLSVCHYVVICYKIYCRSAIILLHVIWPIVGLLLYCYLLLNNKFWSIVCVILYCSMWFDILSICYYIVACYLTHCLSAIYSCLLFDLLSACYYIVLCYLTYCYIVGLLWHRSRRLAWTLRSPTVWCRRWPNTQDSRWRRFWRPYINRPVRSFTCSPKSYFWPRDR